MLVNGYQQTCATSRRTCFNETKAESDNPLLAYVLTPTALVQGFFINGGEVLLGEAVVLYLLGVPLLVFFRKNGVMEKLMKEKR